MKAFFRERRWLSSTDLSIVVSLAVSLLAPISAQAEGNWPDDFLAVYPQAGPTLTAAAEDCSLCHTQVPQRNAYGLSIQPANDGNIRDRLVAVQTVNSDGDEDGAANQCDNITEINADTLPGDANSTPDNCGAGNAPPVAVDDLPGGTAIADTPLNTPVIVDVLANDTDADGDNLTVNGDFDTSSANGGSVSCSLSANTPTPQCTYTPAVNDCGADTFTYRAFDGTDPSTETDRATVTIDVGDANPPIVTAPADLTITLPAGSTGPVPATDPEIQAWLASASAEDPEEGSVAVNNNAPAAFPVGTTPVTFTANDSCGNTGSAAASVVIQIADNAIPVVTAPTPDPLLVTAPLCSTSVPQSDTADNFAGTIADWLGTATATDAEDGPLAVNNNALTDFPLGNTFVTFSATDGLGATGEATATVSVVETPNDAPVVTVPTPDPLIITVAAGTPSVPANDPTIATWLASASASDVQDGTLTVSNDAPANFPIGTTVVNFTATDRCGVTTTASASVTLEVQGNTTPVVTAPDSLTVDAPLCATSIPAADEPIASWLASATANDAEDGTLPVSNDAPDDFPIGATTVMFSATDSGGATGAATSTATVNDTNTAPVVTAPTPDPLVITVAAGIPSVPANDPTIAAWLASASASDEQDGTLSVSNDAPTDFPLGTMAVTFSATDSCNATSTVTASVTIQEEVVLVGADVYLSRLQIPNRLNVRKGQVVKRNATAKGDGTQLTQDASVVLSAVASPNVGVVVEPVSVEEQVVPGNPETRFRFTLFISCNAGGAGTVDWTATINAEGNDDPNNDVVTGTTSVQCAGRGNDGADDHDDEDDEDDEDDD
jgi:hypothetical protein